ncbi:MAG TPA: S4 domain-containing protein [Candidatus Brocadiia bacterium]|nr:S4 domain-containing protein [Candidatus Brocadiia bacterium]
MKVRLQKFLAGAGIGSRRECEKLIEDGRVAVNGEVVTRLGTQVDPGSDSVEFDGAAVKPPQVATFLLYKPRGFSCAEHCNDCPSALELLGVRDERLLLAPPMSPNYSGIVLATSDGELAHALSYPGFSILRTYVIRFKGDLDEAGTRFLRYSFKLEGGRPAGMNVKLAESRKGSMTAATVTLLRGRDTDVARAFGMVSCEIVSLKMTGLGGLTLGTLKPGQSRRLKSSEVRELIESGQARRGKRSKRPDSDTRRGGYNP